MTKTLRERFVAALLKRGEKAVKETTKTIVFSRKEGGFYYIGKSGSLRYGPTKTASIPCTDMFKFKLGLETLSSGSV